ncbi:MAG: hypothetical protein AAB440_00715 [Patescibacteria group bacterium]
MRILLILAGLMLGVAVLMTVNSSSVSYPEVRELAQHDTDSFQELSTYFRKLAELKGAPYAFEVLMRAPLPPDTDPHLLGHIIGDVLYAQKGIDGIALCTDDFRNACSHSVVIGILTEHGEGSLPLVAETCRQAPGGTGAYTMCYHGLGHGVLAYVGYDLERAVAMCKLTGTIEYRDQEYTECVGGTIMEMIAGIHDPLAWEQQVTKYFKDDDPLYPCDASFMPEVARERCYTYLTPHLFTAADLTPSGAGPHDYRNAFAFCDAIPLRRTDLREACNGGFGKEFVALVKDRDIRTIGTMDEASVKNVRAWCAHAGSEEGEAACARHALASLFWGGESEPDAAFLFCEVAEGTSQTRCYQELSGHIAYYLSGTLYGQTLCARLPEAFQKPCGIL